MVKTSERADGARKRRRRCKGAGRHRFTTLEVVAVAAESDPGGTLDQELDADDFDLGV